MRTNSMATILKLLTLCALAHSITAFSIPATEPSTDPPEYLIVRGEGNVQRTAVDESFNLAAAKLLEEHHNKPTLRAVVDEETTTTEPLLECNDPVLKTAFSAYDYTILLSMLVISLGIGIFYGFCQKKTETSSNDFLLGSEMSLFPVTLSLTTSFVTAIELLGNPSEMYFQGTQFVLIVIPMILVIPVAIKVFYPIFFKMELTSCYEYLGIRFGKEIRVLGAVLYVIQMCFYTAVAVLAPAIALSKATGLNTKVAVVLIYAVCVFYSSQGGMKAVVIADTFQAIVLAISLVIPIGLGYFYSGTPYDIFLTAEERDRLEFFNFDFNPTTRHTVWAVVIGGFFYWTSLFCTNQASVQKCMSLKSLPSAKKALTFAILGLVAVFLTNFYTGLMVFKHFENCDPMVAGVISASDQLLPYYIINTYEHVYTVAGIFVAGIFAASLGTVASALNSLSAVTCEDLLINGMNIKISPDKGALYAKWMSLGYGILSFGLVFIVERLGGVLQATLTLNGLVGGVTLGLFVLGIISKKANTKGTFYGGLVSLSVVIFIGVVSQLTNLEPESLNLSVDNCNCHVNITLAPTAPPLSTIVIAENTGFSSWPIFHLSYMWYSMIGCLLTICLGYVFSIIIEAMQKRNVLKINSAKAALEHTDVNLKTAPNWRAENVNSSILLSATSLSTISDKLGHINLAARLDDE